MAGEANLTHQPSFGERAINVAFSTAIGTALGAAVGAGTNMLLNTETVQGWVGNTPADTQQVAANNIPVSTVATQPLSTTNTGDLNLDLNNLDLRSYDLSNGLPVESPSPVNLGELTKVPTAPLSGAPSLITDAQRAAFESMREPTPIDCVSPAVETVFPLPLTPAGEASLIANAASGNPFIALAGAAGDQTVGAGSVTPAGAASIVANALGGNPVAALPVGEAIDQAVKAGTAAGDQALASAPASTPKTSWAQAAKTGAKWGAGIGAGAGLLDGVLGEFTRREAARRQAQNPDGQEIG